MPPSTGGALAPPPPPTIVPPPSAQQRRRDGAVNGRQAGGVAGRGAADGDNDEDDDSGDIAAINRISISVEGAGTAPRQSVQPRNSEDGPSRHEQNSESKTSMSSLRSLLGVPAKSGMQAPPMRSQLAVPASTTAASAPQGIGGAPSARIGGNGMPVASSAEAAASTLSINKDGQRIIPSEIAPKRKKVVLGPGCSALDWARTKGEIAQQRQKMASVGGLAMRKITPSELKKHNTRESAWSVFQGKVYDITPYLRFHPGGIDELMRVAGRDGTRLFMLTHSWVNVDAMIDACCVGILVSEPSS